MRILDSIGIKGRIISILFVSFIILVCFSCSQEDLSTFEFPTSYEDTSVPVTSTIETEDRTVGIGTTTYNVAADKVFPEGQRDLFRPVFRIPSLIITEKGTKLVTCENRQTYEDKDEIDIVLSRQEVKQTSWSIRRIWSNDTLTYGRSMNSVFIIDKIGTFGFRGRVFLFTCHFKQGVGFANEAMTEDFDIVYKYSDDEGETWSQEYSIKENCDFSQYDTVIPSAANGIQLEDGTLLLPTMINVNSQWHSGIVYLTPHGKWHYSSPTPKAGDNECTVYIDNDGSVILDCRTTDKVRRKYRYDMENNTWNQILQYTVTLNLKAEITRCTLNGQSLYLTCYCDSNEGVRENITLYGSLDAIDWKKICLLQSGPCHFGYANASATNNHIAVTFETFYWGTRVIDLSHLKDEIVEAIID